MSAGEDDNDDPRKQLAALDSQISKLQAQIDQLARKRAPLKRKINQYFSPILSLPVELCSEIFAACFPPAWQPEQRCSPLVLGQVCTAWRNLAWSMPCLWNTINFKSAHPTAAHAQLLEQWILRSASLPLYIHFDVQVERLDVMFGEFVHVMDVLARSSKRWRTINFDVPFFFSPETFRSIPSSLPILTSAIVKVKHVTTPFDMFLSAPHLQDLQLLGFTQNFLHLRWDLITRLRLNPTTVQQCLEILGDAQNLTHCVFENILRSDVLDPTPILAPKLQFLEIISFTHTPISELLDTIVVPSVTELSFHVTGNTFPYWSFISLVARSSCDLQRLTLNAVRIHEWQLWDCLRVVPSLLFLHLINLDRISNETIRALNPQNHLMVGSQHIVPMLKEFIYTGSLEANFLVMANMMYSRWRGLGAEGKPLGSMDGGNNNNNSGGKVAQLQSFKFTTTRMALLDADDEFQLSYMQQLATEGMKISLTTRERTWI